MRRHLLPLTLLMLVAASAPAFAQIYAWRDANGTLVLSDRKLDPTAATYAVPSVGCTGGALTIASGVDGAFGLDLDVGEYRVFGGTIALPSPYTTVTISEGGTVACEIRTGAPGSISCS